MKAAEYVQKDLGAARWLEASSRLMKTILVLRHGKSDWSDPYQADFDRPLAKRGRKGTAGFVNAVLRNVARAIEYQGTGERTEDRRTLPLSGGRISVSCNLK